jgi:hypothetical protein
MRSIERNVSSNVGGSGALRGCLTDCGGMRDNWRFTTLIPHPQHRSHNHQYVKLPPARNVYTVGSFGIPSIIEGAPTAISTGCLQG